MITTTMIKTKKTNNTTVLHGRADLPAICYPNIIIFAKNGNIQSPSKDITIPVLPSIITRDGFRLDSDMIYKDIKICRAAHVLRKGLIDAPYHANLSGEHMFVSVLGSPNDDEETIAVMCMGNLGKTKAGIFEIFSLHHKGVDVPIIIFEQKLWVHKDYYNPSILL